MSNYDQRCEADLAAVRTAIAGGNFEEAKRRLRAVSHYFLPVSKFSRQIGDLYFDLGYPEVAGRYWYLIEEKSNEMAGACRAFEHSLGDDPAAIQRALGWDFDLSPFAKTTLEELQARATMFHEEYGYGPVRVRASRLRDRLALGGCAILAFIALFILGAGITFIGTWFR